MSKTPDVAVITSLYRTERFLPAYIRMMRAVATECQQVGVVFELVLVSNDATAEERRLLDTLQPFDGVLQIIHVARESIYASWNRGIHAAMAPYFGVCGVDDERMATALIELKQMVQAPTYDLLDFPYTIAHKYGKQHYGPFQTPMSAAEVGKVRPGVFFIASKALYQQVGPFDERFRIAGDIEWFYRALAATPVDRRMSGTVKAGVHHIHGGNLSTQFAFTWAEANVCRLMHQQTDWLFPAPPHIMRQVWERWGAEEVPITPALATRLWGWRAYWRWYGERALERLWYYVRAVPYKLGLKRFSISVEK
jgi:glycosyltransferase involved in cell wall biosynthesis